MNWLFNLLWRYQVRQEITDIRREILTTRKEALRLMKLHSKGDTVG